MSLCARHCPVSPLRSETPTLRFGPSGDSARRSAKRWAQEEESRREARANTYDNVSNHTGFSHSNIQPQTVAGGVLIVQFRAEIALSRGDGFMAQAQLNLFERRLSVARQLGEGPAQVMRPNRRRVGLPAVAERHAVNALLAQSGLADLELVRAPTCAPADQPRRDPCHRCPRINKRLDPARNRNSSEIVTLARDVNDAPSAFALLEVFDRERGAFGPAQACPDQERQYRAIAEAERGCGVRRLHIC